MGHPASGARTFRAALLASSALHLVILFLLQDALVEDRATTVVRARLMPIVRFIPPRLVGTGQLTVPAPQWGSLAPDRLPGGPVPMGPGVGPGAGEGAGGGGGLPSLGPGGGAPGPPLALRDYDPGAKAAAPVFEREAMVPVGRLGPTAAALPPPTDLLRIADLARSWRQHAVVIRDPSSRRDLTGFINLPRIQVYGAGTGRGVGMDALARFARDNSHLLVQVSRQPHAYFLSPELLKDPIVFLFMGGGFEPYSDAALTHFSDEEKAVLRQYLDGGGLLYIEAGNSTQGHRFLREMVGHLRAILGDDGDVAPMPADHPLYSAFYDWGDGFPGEQGKRDDPYPDISYRWELPAEPAETIGGGGTDLPIDPRLAATQQERPRPLGLWQVRSRGRTVALLSDIELSVIWGASYDDQKPEGPDDSATGALMAGLNLIVYALTREGTLTAELPRPVWMSTRPEAPLPGAGSAVSGPWPAGDTGPLRPGSDALLGGGPSAAEWLGEEVMGALDGELAVVRAPLGTTGEDRPLKLRLDGVWALELPQTAGHGVLLRNVPPGRHWLEVGYAGGSRQVELEVGGGRVSTVTFGVDRFGFVRRLRLNVDQRRVRPEEWPAAFGQLRLEEVYLGDDRDLVDSAARLLRE